MGRYKALKRVMGIIMIIGIIAFSLFISYHIVRPNHESIKAVKGHVDLSHSDFQKEGIAFLNGEWEFYPQKLLKPAELAAEKADFIKVPGHWNKENSAQQPVRGSATYRLTIKLPEHQEPLALRIQNIWMAHRLYVNGTLVKEMGVPAENAESYEPGNTPYTILLEPTEKLELVLQISNYIYYTGGVTHPILLGEREAIERYSMSSFGNDMVGFFLFMLFGIYHLHMYQMRDKESTYLYSGLFLISVSIYILTSGEKLLLRLVEGVPFEPAHKLQDFSLFASMAILVLFVQSLESHLVKKKTLVLGLAPIIGFLGLVVLTPYHFYTWIKLYFLIYSNLLLFLSALRLIYLSIKRKGHQLPLNEAFWVMASIVFVGIAVFVGMLYYSARADTKLIYTLSLLGFLLSLNIFLARRFTNKINEVQALSEELKKANEIKDEFLARTSHELKTPLHGIINISAHLLKKGQDNLTPGQMENIALIQDTSNKLSLLVNDLIDVIKLRHEDLQVNLMTVDLHVMVQLVFQLLAFDLQGKEVALINRVKPLTFVEADENRLRQILYNLFSNAMKHTEKGEITAEAKEVYEHVVLTVADTGKGIPREQWEQVFEDFYSTPSNHQDFYAGMGLGLSISRRLAKKMNGNLWISNSIVGEGTTLSLRLPKGQFLVSSSALTEETVKRLYIERPAASVPNEAGLKRILLVDDEPTNIQVLSLVLEGSYQILTARGGEEALKLLLGEKVHLVITDMIMPVMSGIQLTQRIREIHSMIDLPIIIATVRNSDKEIELAYQTGVNDYITKPFTAEEIQSRVKILLQLTDTMERALQNEIAFLQAQIKPHFLYNALSNVIALCYEDGEKAAQTLFSFSRYLRYIFQADHAGQMLPLQQELDIIKAYVEIEKLRFGSRLHYEAHIDSKLLKEDIMIPVLLIQPLIENAIRHGLFNKEGVGKVSLTITEEAEFVHITVEDDGIGMEKDRVYQVLHGKEGKGVGIQNIQRRIVSFPRASFFIDSEPKKGTRCDLYLPKELLKS